MKEKDLDLGRALKIVLDLGGRRKKESDAETLRAMLKGKDISEVVNLMICAGEHLQQKNTSVLPLVLQVDSDSRDAYPLVRLV